MEANKETLEEAIKREYEARKFNSDFPFDPQSFKLGAKWQAERMYTEEELKEAFRQGQDNLEYSEMFGWDSKLTEQQWFEQFKKY